ncbi:MULTISPECIES: hypothetical protein [unclassified Frankia]|uniref:hypothetical protein n=1 Tax=unclassified Frankia TaxID=2632575 RepID=UPI0020249AB2
MPACFTDGTRATADVLIDADGIRSAVQGLIRPGRPRPRHTGLLDFGARLDHTGIPSTWGRMHLAFGWRAFFGYLVFDDGSGGWFANRPSREPTTTAEARAVGAEEWLRVPEDERLRDIVKQTSDQQTTRARPRGEATR